MNLAVDVHASLDLSAPVGQARASLLAHLDTDAILRALLSGDAATVVTGDLGSALADLGSGLLASPQSLLEPLEAALRQVAGELDLGPLGRLGDLLDTLETVGRIAERVVALTAPGISALDLGSVTGSDGPSLTGGSFGDVVNLVLETVDLPKQLAPVADLRAAVAAIDGFTVGGDVDALVDALAPVLVPLPLPLLRDLRAHLDRLDVRVARRPDPGALVAAIDRWSAALDAVASAQAPDANLLSAVARAQDAVATALDAQVGAVGAWLDGLGCATWVVDLRRRLDLLPAVPSVRIDMLTRDLAADVSGLRAVIAAASDQAILDGLGRFAAQAHAFVEGTLGGIPELLDAAEARVNELLAQLPTRAFRALLLQSVDDLVDRIDGLGIDAVPRAVEAAVAELRAVLEGDVVGRVQGAVSGVLEDVNAAVGKLEDLLGDVTDSLDAAVGAVTPVLARVQAAVAGFTGELEAVVELRGELDLPGAAARSVEAVDEIAAAVSELLGGGALPDALRPLLEQAADELSTIDLSAIIAEPAAAAVAELKVELPAEVEGLLADVAALLRDALPTELVAELDAPVLAVAEAIAGFDPVSLLSGVSDVVTSAASTVESLDPRPYVATAETAFREVLAQLDRLDPTRLLAPVAGVYEALVAKLGAIDPESVGDRMLSGFEAVGAPLQQAVSTAASRLGAEARPPAAGGLPAPGLPPEPAAPADRPAPLFRPGDAIRALGSVLDRIRLALEPLDDAVLVPALREVRALTAGLADRAAPDRVHGVLSAAFREAAAPLRLDVALPSTVRLRAAWDRASARHQLDARLAPTAVFSVRAPAVTALGARVDACVRELAAVSDRLSAFVTSLLGAVPGGLTAEIDGRGPVDAFLAQLDPEPVAAALDALAAEAATRVLAVGAALADAMQALRADIEARLREIGPDAIMERLVRLLLLVRLELDRMNPAEIARDLRPVFLAVRRRIEAWSPVALAGRVAQATAAVADALRALDPAELLGDLTSLDGLAARVAALAPGRRLEPLAATLGELGDQLAGLDLDASIAVVTDTAADVLTELTEAVDVVLAGLADLLRSLGSDSRLSVRIDVEVTV